MHSVRDEVRRKAQSRSPKFSVLKGESGLLFLLCDLTKIMFGKYFLEGVQERKSNGDLWR